MRIDLQQGVRPEPALSVDGVLAQFVPDAPNGRTKLELPGYQPITGGIEPGMAPGTAANGEVGLSHGV